MIMDSSLLSKSNELVDTVAFAVAGTEDESV